MSYQVLARKWRPRDFSQVVGQGHVLRALVNALDSGRLHHAYLFTGTRGVGKTTLARVFAKALNCETGVSSTPCGHCSACVELDGGRFVDLIEVDAASRTRVDETRDLLDNVQYAPTRGRYKVYLIDEVHMFSNHSFNALLKTLEEPPPHVKFLLATTDPKRLPVTILSRCLQLNLKRLSVEQLHGQLASVLEREGVPAEEGALRLIAQAADGSVRDALSLLDQAIAYGGGTVSEEETAVMLGAVAAGHVQGFVDALAEGDGARLITLAREVAELAPDFAQVLGELLSLLRRIAVVQTLGPAAAEALGETPDVVARAARLTAEDCQLFYQVGLIARRDLPLAPDPQAGFEMALLRMLAFRPASAEHPGPAAASAPGAPPPASRGAAGSARRDGSPAAAPRGGARPEARAATASAPPVAGKSPVRPASARMETTPSAATTAEPPAPKPAGTAPASATSEPVAPPLPATPVEAAAPRTALEWAALVGALDLVGLGRELARHSALAACDGRLIELVLSPQFANLNRERHVKSLEDALRERLGAAVSVRVRVAEAAGIATPAEQAVAAATARQAEAARAIEADPNVQILKRELGAVIESVSAK